MSEGDGLRTRLLSKHSGHCVGQEHTEDGLWSTPWYWTGKTSWLDKNGRKPGRGSGTTEWLVMGCNTTGDRPCEAVLLVSVGSILEMVPHGFEVVHDAKVFLNIIVRRRSA